MKKEIKEKIISFEEKQNPQAQCVKIINLKVYKRQNMAMYDAIVYDDQNGVQTRYNDCDIDLSIFN